MKISATSGLMEKISGYPPDNLMQAVRERSVIWFFDIFQAGDMPFKSILFPPEFTIIIVNHAVKLLKERKYLTYAD